MSATMYRPWLSMSTRRYLILYPEYGIDVERLQAVTRYSVLFASRSNDRHIRSLIYVDIGRRSRKGVAEYNAIIRKRDLGS